ncbi:hypothetical protein ACFWF7_01335 [Nocardia sp. NPDC060256]|uniref:hypothetical protein n=1 Tax=unclassified Nocardia TaxID=2637762 RepID=UPI0036495C9A
MTTRARIRANTDTGWQTVDITSRRYPGEVGRILHIIRIAKADEDVLVIEGRETAEQRNAIPSSDEPASER